MARYVYKRFDILRVFRGDTFEANFRIGPELNLDGCTVRAQVRRYEDDSRIVLNLDTELDLQYLLLKKPASSMKHVEPGLYVYDVEITEPDLYVSTLFGGKFQIKHDVSR